MSSAKRKQFEYLTALHKSFMATMKRFVRQVGQLRRINEKMMMMMMIMTIIIILIIIITGIIPNILH